MRKLRKNITPSDNGAFLTTNAARKKNDNLHKRATSWGRTLSTVEKEKLCGNIKMWECFLGSGGDGFLETHCRKIKDFEQMTASQTLLQHRSFCVWGLKEVLCAVFWLQ
jgi:hypothetical protein